VKSRFTNLIRKNQVTSFILFTLFFSYAIGLPFNIWTTKHFKGSSEFIATYLPRLIIVIGPALAATIVTYFVKRRHGVKNLVMKLIPRKDHWPWYLLLPIITSSITITSFLVGGFHFDTLSIIITDHWIVFIGHLILQTLIIGIGEELGWRGWLLPKLSEKYSLAVTILFVTIVWGLWHFPILLKGHNIVIPWLFLLVSESVILSWIWLKAKGNIFIFAITHASINSPQFFFESRLAKDNPQILLESWQINGYIYLAIALVFIFQMRDRLYDTIRLRNG